MSWKQIPVLILACLIIVSCSDDDSDNPTSPGHQLSAEDAILPLADGNYWIMKVTTTTNGVEVTAFDTIRCSGPQTLYNDEEWFTVGGNWPTNQPFRNMEGGMAVWAKNTQSIYYKYPAQTGETLQAVLGEGLVTVTVTGTNESLTVPAGTFTCYQYAWGDPASSEGLTFSLMPRVGLVQMTYHNEIVSPQYPNGYTQDKVAELVEYHLEN